jgi:hypothetical protein
MNNEEKNAWMAMIHLVFIDKNEKGIQKIVGGDTKPREGR